MKNWVVLFTLKSCMSVQVKYYDSGTQDTEKIRYWSWLEISTTLVEETDTNPHLDCYVICVFQEEEALRCLGLDKRGFTE